MDTTVRDPLVGRVLDGRYEVSSRIARGGMAIVYSGRDQRLDRKVALKVMYPHLAEDEEFVDRFIREARSAARLSHPNVVQVFDQGSDEDAVYLAMELLPGRTLREVLTERGALTPREALTVVEPMLEALNAAHHEGLVHRDVKPENVILTDDGRVKVTDFGLARAVSGTHTQTGALIGTVAYLAPELVTLGQADPRSDVYAAGIVLFELLTGRQPFTGELPMQVAYRHVHEDVPRPSGLVATLPTELDDLVTAAVARDRNDRPADAGAWLQMVRRVRAELTDTVLDAVPAVALSSRDVSTGDPTELVGQLVTHNPTQTLPAFEQFAGLSGLRERQRREALEDDGLLDDDPDVDDESQESVGAAVSRGQRSIDPAQVETRRSRRWRRREREDDVPEVAAARPLPEPQSAEMDELRRMASGRRKRGVLGLLVVLGITFALAGASWYLVAGPGAFITTPQLTNLTEQEARESLIGTGLELRVEQGDYSDTVEEGKILRTRPDAGRRIRKDGAVSVYLSLGPENSGVPKLVGLEQSRAESALERAGLTVGAITESFDDKIERGRVIGSTPGSGQELKLGSAVDLVVSKGREQVQVPDVRGRWLDEAKQAFGDVGLQLKVTEAENRDYEPGRVLEQDREPGTTVDKGSTINLVVAKGPSQIQMPDVQGWNMDDAQRHLEGLGLRVERFGGDFRNTVDRQRPDPGAEVKAGDKVRIAGF